MNKKALLIKLSPSNSLESSVMRTLGVIKGLLLNGYDVDWIVTKSNSNHTVRSLDQYGFLDRVNVISLSGNAQYENIIKNENENRYRKIIVSAIRKLFHKVSVFGSTKKIANNISLDSLPRHEYDVVISVSDPKTSHIAVKRLFKQGLKTKNWVQYWGDPLVGDITRSTLYPSFIMRRIEFKLMEKANKVVFTSPFTLNDEQKMHKKVRDKMICLPTPYAYERIYAGSGSEVLNVAYFGAYKSNVRNILPLYRAFEQLGKDYYLNIVGDSDVILQPQNNIYVAPRGDVTKLENKMDLFICILNSSGTQIPGKVYHYAASNKPILVILDGEHQNDIREYLSQFDRFYFCNNNEESISDTIQAIRISKKEYNPCNMIEPGRVVNEMLTF